MLRLLRAGVVAFLVTGVLSPGVGATEPVQPLSGPAAPPELSDPNDGSVPAPPLPAESPTAPATDVSPGLPPDIAALWASVLPAPVGDGFFDDEPVNSAAYANGRVIESRDVTPTAAPLVVTGVRQVTQLKFRTTDANGDPTFGTATLLVPAAPWPGPDDRPVFVNNLAIDGLGKQCTPSYTLAHGVSLNTNAADFIPPTTSLALARGYAVLIPDHEGPRMAYAEPYVAGHVVLDAIRAVRDFGPTEFTHSRFALAGYSGGAIATLGAAKLIDDYASELADSIAGAAIGGVPADPEMLTHTMSGNVASGLLFAATLGIARERPEILGYANHLARWVAASPVKDLCGQVLGAGGLAMLRVEAAANVVDPLHTATAQRIFRTLRMSGMKAGAPLYIYNGEQEVWVPAEGARNLYREQCELGVHAVYRSVFGEHYLAGLIGYPDVLRWLDQRLQGIPAPNEC